MKKYIYITSLLVASVFAASCSQDLLNIEQHGVVPVDATYLEASDETARELLANINAEVIWLTMGDWGVDLIATASSKVADFWPGGSGPSDGSDYQKMARFVDDSELGPYKTMYQRYYRIIYKANLIVEKLNQDSAERKIIVGEAMAWRAWAMMHLTALWGSAPLVNHTLDGINFSFTPANTPAEESWAWICNEFEAAAVLLPTKSGLGGQKAIGGRWSKEAAIAFKAKAYMWQNDYKNAKVELARVINSGKYALWTKTATMGPASYGTNTLAYKDKMLAAGNTWIDGNDDYVYSTVWRHEADFCDEFLLEIDIDGDQNTVTDVEPYWFRAYTNWRNDELYDPANTTHNDGWGFINPTRTLGLFLSKHDGNGPRRRATVATMSEVYFDFPYGDSAIRGVMEGKKLFAVEGYMRMKWYDFLDDVNPDRYAAGNGFGNRTNFPLLRYSDILLLYAEACCKDGEGTAKISGLEALNMVRRRAGLTEAPALVMDDFMTGIKAERRCELCLEDINRWVDLIRWGDYGSFINDNSDDGVGQYWGTNVCYFEGLKNPEQRTDDPTDLSNYIITYERTADKGSFDEEKYRLLPFPFEELTLNPNLKQNPKW